MSERKYDRHNRFRNKTIAFRVSTEEDEQINFAVSLTGMTKQDYITSKLLDRNITVKGNCKIHRAVYDRLTELLTELQRLSTGCEINDELIENIEMLINIASGIYQKTA